MAVVLDTAGHPPRERVELVHEVIERGGVSTQVALRGPVEAVTLRMEAWDLPSVYLLRSEGRGGLHLTRTERQVRRDAPEVLALAVHTGTGAAYDACGTRQQLATGDLHITDLTGAYEYAEGSTSGAAAVHMSYDDLGLPVDVVRTAIPLLRCSTLAPLVRDHLVGLFRAADAIDPVSPAAASLSAATLDLTRALVATAAGNRCERDVLHESLRARIVAHLNRHLHEPDLTPARVARAHHISLRTLYNVWGQREPTLVEWIMQRRLEGARHDLARAALAPPGRAPEPISSIARRWGFPDAGHFSRRFRAAYGVSPGDHRRAAAADRA